VVTKKGATVSTSYCVLQKLSLKPLTVTSTQSEWFSLGVWCGYAKLKSALSVGGFHSASGVSLFKIPVDNITCVILSSYFFEIIQPENQSTRWSL
jgi:hypothetical protein